MNDDIERRYISSELEVRISEDVNRRPTIVGHAAVFGVPSLEIFGVAGWREIIRPQAFAKAIRKDDVRALVNHDDNRLIGRVSNRTLFLQEDDVGLSVQIFPPDTTEARDLLTLIRGKYISEMSFGFRVAPDGHRIDEANKLREIVEVSNLYDVSVVNMAAYPATDVGLRSFLAGMSAAGQDEVDFLKRQKEREEFLKGHAPQVDPLDMRQIAKKYFVPSFN